MADITVTNSNIEVENVAKEVTFNAATESGADVAQKFIINNKKADWKTAILIKNGSASDELTYTFAAGEMQGAKTVAGTVEASKTVVIELENLKVAKNNGDIELTLTPASGKALTGHAAEVAVIALA